MNAPLLHLHTNDALALDPTEQQPPSHPAAQPGAPFDPSLSELRLAIETIDETIVRVIAERMALSRAVGRVKVATGQPIMDPAREAAVVARAALLARDVGLPEDEIRALYWRLIACSRRAQLNA